MNIPEIGTKIIKAFKSGAGNIKTSGATSELCSNPVSAKALRPLLTKDELQLSLIIDKNWRNLVQNLDSYITPENFLGGGAEAEVYKLTDKYVLRLYGGTKNAGRQKFKPVIDIFEGKNFGQPVAISENHQVSINRFVNGNIMYKCMDYNPDVYLKKLEEYSALPDKTLEEFIADVAFINKKGFRIDESNPENFLFNPVTKKIGIVDICKKGSSLDLYGPYGHDWIVSVLCNEHDFLDCASRMRPEQRARMIELISKIERRILPICKKYGIPTAKYNNNDYLKFSIAEFLHSIDKINPHAKEGICHQLVRLNNPDLIPNLARMDINF